MSSGFGSSTAWGLGQQGCMASSTVHKPASGGCSGTTTTSKGCRGSGWAAVARGGALGTRCRSKWSSSTAVVLGIAGAGAWGF